MVSKAAAKEKRVLPLRARRDEDKEARRRLILEAARVLFTTTSYAEVKMADVAEKARLAKGTVFLYFPTKEALFLALLEELLFAWFHRLDGWLEQDTGPWTGARLAGWVAESMEHQASLPRLMGILQNVLEHNIPLEHARAFKERLRETLGHTGALLEQRLRFLKPGEGPRLLLRLNALMMGLWLMADEAPVTRELLDLPHLSVLRVDFQRELAESMTLLLRGLETR
ncbi:TetR/AcrR family transcriptional regulator [Stigmatella aurantiaca]|uniref:Transcriptional regulator, TetR family n=1 Tax=Stigmatella aurantiaca (strain DW4/3-1) TaxID=378806 RepID=E3FLT5_STIAD|nr:TetR family transcriptional regulator [Stigmatella aurantiaca]ADO75534.1 Transcriptional regulator, TetR family [Stigmatella aurantiaca DW4/3-1]